jgi:hypothetical protein
MRDNIHNCRILYVKETEVNGVKERLVVVCNGGVVKFSRCKGYPFLNILQKRRKEKLGIDKYTCFSCGNTANTVHHKDNDTYDHSLNNLVSLCDSCHIKLHKSGVNEDGLDR